MSIKEDRAEIKSLTRDIGSKHRVYEDTETQIIEEEFDIVPKNSPKALFTQDRLVVSAIIILIGLLAYGVGKLTTLTAQDTQVKILYPEQGAVKGVSTSTVPTDTKVNVTSTTPAQKNISSVSENTGDIVVASKSGTKYHYPWCSGAKRISPINLVTYASIYDARKAGLTPAANCKGLK